MTTWLYTLLVFLRQIDAANPFFFLPPTHVVPSTSSCLHHGHHHRHSHHLVTSSALLPVRSTSLFCGRARAHTQTLTHRHTRARTSGNSQSVYMYREGGGYLSPSLAFSRYHCRAELQGQQRQRAPTPDQ